MKQLLIPSLIVTSLALTGCASKSNNNDVSINPAFVQTKTLPTKQTLIQPAVTQPTYPSVKRAQGMVPLVTQADVSTQSMPQTHATTSQPHRIVIRETYHPANPITTGMVQINGKTLPLTQAPQYLQTLQQQRQSYLNKATEFTHEIEHIYIGDQALTPAQTHALLQYMGSQKHSLHYNNLQNLPIKPGMKFDLHLKHIIVDDQTLTGPAAIGFVNGLVASSQSHAMQPVTPATRTTMPMQRYNMSTPQYSTPAYPTQRVAIPSTASQQVVNNMGQPPVATAPTSYRGEMHNNRSHQEPMHYHMPPQPNSATPTTSIVEQPQQNTGP